MSEELNPAPYSCAASGCLHDILATRLAAAEAERDAAVIENARLRQKLADVANMTEWSIIEAATNNVRQAIKADIKRALRQQTIDTAAPK